MRVAELADLTGTTVRTVRYYHSLGLLPVPAERGGWRDYDLSHVARLSRIRHLVQAGVPLGAVARILDNVSSPGQRTARGAAVTADLEAALTAAEDQLAEATRQRDMLRSLLERAREGSTVSPMPEAMAAFFDRMEASAPDETTRTAVQRERDVTDLACYRGLMPPEAAYLFPDASEVQEDAASLEAYGRDTANLSDEEIEERARWIVGRLERRLSPERRRALARSVDVPTVRALYATMSRADPHYARVAPVVGAHLEALIERWRAS